MGHSHKGAQTCGPAMCLEGEEPEALVSSTSDAVTVEEGEELSNNEDVHAGLIYWQPNTLSVYGSDRD